MLSDLFTNWLLVGAHPDDVELGCGGIVSKFSKKVKMTYLVVSPATDDPRNKNILEELAESCKILELQDKPVVWSYVRRRLHESRYDIRQDLYKFVVNDLKPDLIFVPSLKDLHPDHSLIAEETARMFRDRTILGYEVVTGNRFDPMLYVGLDDASVSKKVKALMSYGSQLGRNYFNEEVIRSMARLRGAQVNMQYAESFEVLRMVI